MAVAPGGQITVQLKNHTRIDDKHRNGDRCIVIFACVARTTQRVLGRCEPRMIAMIAKNRHENTASRRCRRRHRRTRTIAAAAGLDAQIAVRPDVFAAGYRMDDDPAHLTPFPDGKIGALMLLGG